MLRVLDSCVRIGKGGFLSCKQGSAETLHFYSLFSLNLYKFTQSTYEVHLAILNQSVVLRWVQNKSRKLHCGWAALNWHGPYFYTGRANSAVYKIAVGWEERPIHEMLII